MCFSAALTRETIERDPRFHHLLDGPGLSTGIRISGFTSPGMPLLRSDPDSPAELGRWGLVPAWVRDAARAKKIRSGTVNARWESLSSKPSFRDSWPGKRCLVPVEGFYEPHVEDGRRSSWYIRRKDGELIYLGGIWQENPLSPEEGGGLSFSVLTLDARDLLARVHNDKLRMPLLVASERMDDWLFSDGSAPVHDDPAWFLDQEKLEAWETDGRSREPVQASGYPADADGQGFLF